MPGGATGLLSTKRRMTVSAAREYAISQHPVMAMIPEGKVKSDAASAKTNATVRPIRRTEARGRSGLSVTRRFTYQTKNVSFIVPLSL